MALALLVSRCDKIASGAAIAGLPYSDTPFSLAGAPHAKKSTDRIAAAMNEEMGRRKRQLPLMIVHATGDRVINIEAAERIKESWEKSFELELSQSNPVKPRKTKGTAWEHRRYTSANGDAAVETVLLEHGEHGWYGGRDGKYGFADAPNVSALIWRFFEDNPLRSAADTRGILRFFKSTRAA